MTVSEYIDLKLQSLAIKAPLIQNLVNFQPFGNNFILLYDGADLYMMAHIFNWDAADLVMVGYN